MRVQVQVRVYVQVLVQMRVHAQMLGQGQVRGWVRMRMHACAHMQVQEVRAQRQVQAQV